MDADHPHTTPSALADALDRGLADAAAGRTVDGAALRQRLRNTVALMEADLAERQQAELSDTTHP